MTTVLERLLIPERLPRRADESTGAGFAIPALQERPLSAEAEPLLASNMRQTFVPTLVSRKRGVARYAMCECSPADEWFLLHEMIRVIQETSKQQGWVNRCPTLAEAAVSMRQQGFEPRTVAVPYSFLEGLGLDSAEADDLMRVQGYVTLVDKVQVLAGPLPSEKALVAAAPVLAGYYTRSDDYLGLLLTRANRAFYVVDGLVG